MSSSLSPAITCGSMWFKSTSPKAIVDGSVFARLLHDYFQRLISENKSPAAPWNTLKSVCPLSTPSSNWDALGSDLISIANSLNDHFVSVSSSNASLPPPSCSYSPSSSLSVACTTPEWCEKSLASLKSSSAPGLDNILSLPLKTSKSIISRPLSNILNSSIS